MQEAMPLAHTIRQTVVTQPSHSQKFPPSTTLSSKFSTNPDMNHPPDVSTVSGLIMVRFTQYKNNSDHVLTRFFPGSDWFRLVQIRVLGPPDMNLVDPAKAVVRFNYQGALVSPNKPKFKKQHGKHHEKIIKSKFMRKRGKVHGDN